MSTANAISVRNAAKKAVRDDIKVTVTCCENERSIAMNVTPVAITQKQGKSVGRQDRSTFEHTNWVNRKPTSPRRTDNNVRSLLLIRDGHLVTMTCILKVSYIETGVKNDDAPALKHVLSSFWS